MGSLSRLRSAISRKLAGNLCGEPTSVSGLFFAFVVASALSWGLLLFSWWILALRSRLVRGYSMGFLYWVEIASATSAALGHFVLLYFAVYWKPPFATALQYVRLCGRRSEVAHINTHISDTKEMPEDDSDGAAGLLEEEERQRGRVSSVAISVGNKEGLQQRSTSRPRATTSGDAKGSVAGTTLFFGGVASRYPSSTSRKLQERLVHFFPYIFGAVVTSICLVHFIIHGTIPNAHRQSQEILLGLVRVYVDVVLLIVYEVFIALRLEKIAALWNGSVGGGSRMSYVRATLYVCGAVLTACTLYTLVCFLHLVFTVDTIEHLQQGVLYSFDICAAEGMKMDPTMAKSWVWPALTHRRLFNFWTGSENCTHASGLTPISYLDPVDRVLVVSPLCFDGKRPKVLLHRPENSEFTGSKDVHLPETQRGNLEYHRQLEALYGTPALAASRNVIVHRDPATRLILSVEVDPKKLATQPRVPRTIDESLARKEWPQGGTNVFSVPLGQSPAYTVLCEAMEHEEYHLFPLDDEMLDAYSAGVDGVRETQCVPDWKRAGHTAPLLSPSPQNDEPAGNVFIMLFDAVSRQEIKRSLPKLSNAIADFLADNATQHLVLEAKGAMTLGINTAANLVPFIAGITANAVGLPREVNFTNVSFVDRAVFVRAKEKYGDALNTAFTSAFCHDLLEYLMGHTTPSSGAGGRVIGIDRYTYQPFCHLDYSGVHSNLRGPYSIVRRCMAGKAVWDHMVNYTEALLDRQLDAGRRAANRSTRHPVRTGDCDATRPGGDYGKYFFHVMYMTEGHEGTHGVIPLVDESLTRFFLDLRFKLRFFDNPLNTFFLLSDHGNHMGHYYGYTRAGEFERGTPPMVLAIHPEVLNRIDANKGRSPNVTRSHLFQRTKRISTPLDTYLTLADILNVKAEVYFKYNAEGVVHPASLFDLRDSVSSQPARRCSQFSSDIEKYRCPLDFCQITQ